MVSVVPTYTENQIAAWLRGLLTITWADGHYDPEEQVLIAEITKDLAAHDEDIVFKSIGPEELAETLGQDERTTENFLRTAVLVAIADGIYSQPEGVHSKIVGDSERRSQLEKKELKAKIKRA